jgi:NADH-quinone oxidoreductase subunit M
MKLFLYTLTGSVLMLVAMAYLFFKSQGSFDLSLWSSMRFNEKELFWLFLAFFAAFAVKIPMWPFHTWLPDAHVEAPTTGSMVLAAIMLKLGAYGFIRFNVPVLLSSQSLVAFDLSMMVIILSLIAIVYISFVALVQEDMKKLVAYSSIAHMGFVTLGIFLLTENSFNSQRVEFLVPNAITGAVVQMISHGFVSAAMFFCIGVLYDRVHSRQISDYGGVMTVMPRFGAFFILFAMANCGLPGTSGFVGELLVLVSAIGSNWLIGAIAATSIILSAAYSLWLVKRILFGPVKRPEIQTLKDLDGREFFILSVLAFFVILLGVYPQLMIQTINGAVESLMTTVQL